MTLKQTVRKLVPEPLISVYHWFLAKLAAIVFGFPSRQLIVIGITGTSGKSTTVQFLGQMLEAAGKRVGWASTVSFKIADKEWVNDKKMTMLGRFQTQKLLRQMVTAGCEYAIVEVSSQGIVQHRHVGINFDIATLTNLWPEHIEAHGGFENYKKAKGKFFEYVAKSPLKKLAGKVIHKSFVVNVDNEHAPYFLGLVGEGNQVVEFRIDTEEVKLSADGSEFNWEDLPAFIEPIGLPNVYNAVCAASITKALDFSLSETVTVMEKIKSVSGRLESIDEGQDFFVIVDYAFEPKALTSLYETIRLLPHQKIIHVLGRPVLGKIAGEKADVVIVTNEDPYDDDPQNIIDQVTAGALEVGKQENENLFRILDRQAAIEKAVALAKTGDLILIYGCG
ncbi:MAG: UDP-N-acetylmuramyl-tripeptide synthetase [Candidatus Uhrbacteria bacterium GW2011_GWF2_44_350]|uniref:UDP-N-acetylmuramyl-tripeptide synthetase n=1 Tax=Candidatus Uhrbacteria bacterium GW2011_GWF2_44_350 TaxID=1619000 RepID=A0A0G1JAC5_9BACT|nr:MAG: UDP-N-acetylmuramyl-tripeptide synthetase [Candidatus Uhrbacteria bacterium GW2011_GWF2_44_350]